MNDQGFRHMYPFPFLNVKEVLGLGEDIKRKVKRGTNFVSGKGQEKEV